MRIFKLRQVKVVILIYHQILLTNLQGNELEGKSWELGLKFFSKAERKGEEGKKR